MSVIVNVASAEQVASHTVRQETNLGNNLTVHNIKRYIKYICL